MDAPGSGIGTSPSFSGDAPAAAWGPQLCGCLHQICPPFQPQESLASVRVPGTPFGPDLRHRVEALWLTPFWG